MSGQLDDPESSAKVLVVLDHEGQPQVMAATCAIRIIVVDNRNTHGHIERIRKHDEPKIDESTFLETIHDELALAIQNREVDVEDINQIVKS